MIISALKLSKQAKVVLIFEERLFSTSEENKYLYIHTIKFIIILKL